MLKSNIRKSLKKIKTKYGLIILILVVIAVFILDLKPTLMRYYSEMTLQAIGYAKEDRTSDITEYTISFNNNGGSGVMGSLTVEEGESVTLTKNTFTKTDYTFNNWNTIPNGTGTEYEDEDTISNVTQNIILYAQWTQKAAYANGKYYDTLQSAIEEVPKNGTKTIVKLLKNVTENLTVYAGQNIEFNLQNYRVTNKIDAAVISNSGTVTIKNGTLYTTAASTGAFNNDKTTSVLIMTGGSIISEGGRQAVYNNNGKVTISGNSYLSATSTIRPALTNNTTSSEAVITGGTIISTGQHGIDNKGVLTVGTKDDVYNPDVITIQGIQYGINSTTNFAFYDGIIKGGNSHAINNIARANPVEEGHKAMFYNVDGDPYSYAGLASNFVRVIFDARGGDCSEEERTIPKDSAIGSLPTATKAGHIFDGWFSLPNGGDQYTSESIISESTTTFYAHWTPRGVVRMNGTVYPTFTEAMKHASNNTETTIYLLENTNEAITIPATKNIVIDLQGYTLSNYKSNRVITNSGTLKIKNGNMFSNAEYGIVDIDANKNLIIDNVQMTITSNRPAIYNSGGTVEITGGSYITASPEGKANDSSSLSRGTLHNKNGGTITIKNATIVSTNQQAISNEAILILGTKDGNPTNQPTIISASKGIVSVGTFKYYDGIIKGITDPIDGTINEQEEDTELIEGTETIDSKTYNTVHLELEVQSGSGTESEPEPEPDAEPEPETGE